MGNSELESLPMRILLFQIRNGDDPMLGQEFRCFDTKLEPLRPEIEYTLESHNIIDQPKGYEGLWKDYDLVMVGGSGDYGCVNNNEPWLLNFCGVLRNMVEAEKPLFCSCFGHQALAKALGGEVATDKSRAELGTLEVTVNEEGQTDTLLGELSPTFPAQFGHNDYVKRLPDGAVNLAHTERCAVQAYRMNGGLVYSTQFHPELSHVENRERAERYIRVYDPRLAEPSKLEQLFQPSKKASALLARFVRLHSTNGSLSSHRDS